MGKIKIGILVFTDKVKDRNDHAHQLKKNFGIRSILKEIDRSSMVKSYEKRKAKYIGNI